MEICTRDAKRGQYARLCVQIPIDQPLLTCVYIGNFHQQIQYKGISLLCHSCRRIGHKPSNCTRQSSSHQLEALHVSLTPGKSTSLSSSLHSKASLSSSHQNSEAPNNKNPSESSSQNLLETLQNPMRNHFSQDITPNSHDSSHGPWLVVHYPKRKKKTQSSIPQYRSTSNLPHNITNSNNNNISVISSSPLSHSQSAPRTKWIEKLSNPNTLSNPKIPPNLPYPSIIPSTNDTSHTPKLSQINQDSSPSLPSNLHGSAQ